MKDIMPQWEMILLYALLLAVVLLPTVVMLVIWYRFRRKKSPAYYSRKVQAILKKYALIHNYKVIGDLELEAGGHTATIDHILIGFFGILVITTMKKRGFYYGDGRSPEWTFEDKDVKSKTPVKTQIPNPVIKAQKDIDVLRTLFSKNNIFKVNIEHLIVYDPYDKKSAMYMRGNVSVLKLNKLKKYLNKAKFDKDADVDVPAIYDLITKNAKHFK